MVHRFGIGVLIIFIGILILISGLWNIFLDALIDRTIGSIIVLGDIYNAIAPNDTQVQVIHVLVGLLLIGIGGFIAKSHIRKQGIIS